MHRRQRKPARSWRASSNVKDSALGGACLAIRGVRPRPGARSPQSLAPLPMAACRTHPSPAQNRRREQSRPPAVWPAHKRQLVGADDACRLRNSGSIVACFHGNARQLSAHRVSSLRRARPRASPRARARSRRSRRFRPWADRYPTSGDRASRTARSAIARPRGPGSRTAPHTAGPAETLSRRRIAGDEAIRKVGDHALERVLRLEQRIPDRPVHQWRIGGLAAFVSRSA